MPSISETRDQQVSRLSQTYEHDLPPSGAVDAIADWRGECAAMAKRGLLSVQRDAYIDLGRRAGLRDPTAIVDDLVRTCEQPSVERASYKPELSLTVEGLRAALKLADWSLSWNTTADRRECRKGGAGDWRPSTGRTLSRMMTDVSEAATANGKPYAFRSARHEERLLDVISSEREQEGDGTAVYDAIRQYVEPLRNRMHLSLHDVVDAAGALDKYEGRGRAKPAVYAAARQALIDAGWRRDHDAHRRRTAQGVGDRQSRRVGGAAAPGVVVVVARSRIFREDKTTLSINVCKGKSHM